MRANAWPMKVTRSLAVLVGAGAMLAMSACGRTPFRCDPSHRCDLAVTSVCTLDNLCAVPAGECPSGYAYDRSTLHAGTCVPSMLLGDASQDADATGSDGGDITPGDGSDIADAPVAICPVPRLLAPISASRITSNHVRLTVRSDPAMVDNIQIEAGIVRAPFVAMTAPPLQTVGATGVANVTVDLGPGVHFWRARAHCSTTTTPSEWSPIWEFVAPHRMGIAVTHSTALPGPLDFNGDGNADLAVGIPGLHAVAIYLGPVISGASVPTIVTGADAFGSVVATAGDLNGDGFTDLLVGSCPAQDEASAERTCGTAITIVYGNETASVTHTQSISAPTMLPFDAGMGSFGTSLSGAGDLNGDGYDDFVVGTGFYPSVGSAVVYYGGAMVAGATGAILANPDPSHLGFGTAVAGLGDVDGDGLSDIAVGGVNLVAVYRGDQGRMTFMNQTPTIVPVGGGTYLGIRLASGGDVDGDGLADLLAGDPRPANAEVQLFLGNAMLDSAVPIATVTQYGANDLTGAGLAGDDDLDHDGHDDFIVGSPQAMSGIGVARVYYGRMDGADLRQTVLSPLASSAVAARFGGTVAMPGALDQNANLFAVGAPGYYSASGNITNGNVYVFDDHVMANPLPLATLSPLFLMPDIPNGAGFGRSIAHADEPRFQRLRWLLGLSAHTVF